MAEAQRARTAAAPLQITITYSNGNWKCNPPNPKAGAHIHNGGQVNFHCSQQGGCRVYTDPPDAFANEVNGYEQLNQGDNTYTCAVPDVYINYCVSDPKWSCTPSKTKETGGYSIQVGTPPMEDEGHRK